MSNIRGKHQATVTEANVQLHSENGSLVLEEGTNDTPTKYASAIKQYPYPDDEEYSGILKYSFDNECLLVKQSCTTGIINIHICIYTYIYIK